jgi:hypothetical protein
MLNKTIAILALCAFTGPTLAQTQSKPTRQLPPRPAVSEAQNDTLQMTCDQTRKIVSSRPDGIVLKTGATRWDRYYHDAEFCGQEHDLVPEFVRTKDNQACMIGYTCHSLSGGAE